MVEFRIKDTKYIMKKIGNRKFKDEDLEQNLKALLHAIAKKRPDSIKGNYFSKAMIKTSMGPLVNLNVEAY